MDKFFQVPTENSTVDGLVSFTFVEGTILFRSEEYRVVLDRLRAPYPWLVLDGIEDLIDWEPQRGEEAQSGSRERIKNACFLKAGCP